MQHTAARPAEGTPGLLHWEPAVDGFWTVWRDTDATGGQIDLEVLFNTVISRPEITRDLFATQGAVS
jgi:hypothetical protein